MTIKTRLAVGYTFTVACILMLMSYFVYFFTEKRLYELLAVSLERNAMMLGMTSLNPDRYSDTLYYEVKEAHFQKLPQERDYIMRIVKGSTTLRFDPNLPLSKDFFSQAIIKGKATHIDSNTAYVALYFKDKLHKEDLLVVSHASAVKVANELLNLKEILILGFVVFVVVTFPVSVWYVRYSFKSIKEIIKAMDKIHSANLDQRLKTDGEEHEFTELNTTFNNLLDRMEVAFNNQQTFISNASHSFRTPLTIIIGESELAIADLKSGRYAEVADSLNVIHNRSIHLKEIINGLLGIIRSEEDGGTDLWGTVRIDEAVARAVENARHIFPANSFKLDIEISQEEEALIQVLGDENLLTLAIQNIINNACKYSDGEPVIIKLEAEETNIILTISDTGIGIPSDELQKVFSPFFRASNASGLEGAGIGLPLTFNILQMHRAKMSISSELWVGTQVKIVFPSVLALRANNKIDRTKAQ
jgi:signal transduction histidine kinase